MCFVKTNHGKIVVYVFRSVTVVCPVLQVNDTWSTALVVGSSSLDAHLLFLDVLLQARNGIQESFIGGYLPMFPGPAQKNPVLFLFVGYPIYLQRRRP